MFRLRFLSFKTCLLGLLACCATFSLSAADRKTYDVVVYGGVPCGIASAIAAAREGANVLLIEPTHHVGGLSTSGINTAESEHMLKWTIGGFALEFYERLGKFYGSGKPEYFFESSAAEKVYLEMLQEAKVPVIYGQNVIKVSKDGAKIRSIELSDHSEISAKVFVDAGYEGDLMAKAGVAYTFGRESKDEYGEEAAGVRFDKTVRQAATVDAEGNLLPGISAWAKDLKEGAAHRGVMNYNFRLTFAKDSALQTPIPQPKHYDAKRYRLLENWLKEKIQSRGESEARRSARFLQTSQWEIRGKQQAKCDHFRGEFRRSV